MVGMRMRQDGEVDRAAGSMWNGPAGQKRPSAVARSITSLQHMRLLTRAYELS